MIRRRCSASPPRPQAPPRVESPRIRLGSEEATRRRARRRGRRQLRVDLNIGGNLPSGSNLQIGS